MRSFDNSPPLIWYSRFLSEGSSAQDTREIVLALDRAGYPVALRNLDPDKVSGQSALDDVRRSRLLDIAARDYPVSESLRVRCARPKTEEAHLVEGMWDRDPRALGNIAFLTTVYGYLPDTTTPATGNRLMDQIWGCSDHVCQTLVETGFDAAKVHRVPLGYAPDIYHEDVEPLDLPTGKAFRFVHVSIPYVVYKGLDLLVRAYFEEFDSGDDTCLVLQTRAYRGMEGSLATLVAQERARTGRNPEVLLRLDFTPPSDLARLYAASSCYVQTSRASGFDMPPLEAMACGRPVIANRWGGHLEFCTDESSYLVDCALVPPPPNAEAGLEGIPIWGEVDVEQLRTTMRWVYEHPDDARGRGRQAAKAVRQSHTWNNAALAVIDAVGRLGR